METSSLFRGEIPLCRVDVPFDRLDVPGDHAAGDGVSFLRFLHEKRLHIALHILAHNIRITPYLP